MLPVAFVPSAPLLHPDIGGPASAATEGIRTASRRAVDTLLSHSSSRVLVLGGLGVGGRPPGQTQAAPLRAWSTTAADCLDEFGLHRGDGQPQKLDHQPGRARSARHTGHRAGPAAEPLPLSLSLGRWLLTTAGFEGAMELLSLDGAPPQVAAAARGLTVPADCGVLVVGDGTATRTEKSPGHYAAGAIALDDGLANALRTGDSQVFDGLPESADTEYLLDGRCAWQGAMAVCRPYGPPSATELLNYQAPHGVAYFVATWLIGTPAHAPAP